MKKVLILLTVFIYFNLSGQVKDTLTLDYCQLQARLNYPLVKQLNLQASSSSLKIKDIKSVNYPQVNLNGQATYQSDVTKIPLNFPGINIPEISKDMYKLNLDISQTIYDGGAVKNQKQLEKVTNQLELENIEAELDKLKSAINDIYFSILLLQQNMELLNITKSDLENNLTIIQSDIKNGVLTASDADILKVEIIGLDEQILEAGYSKQSFIGMLSVYLNSEIPENVVLLVPENIADVSKIEDKRRELNVFEFQKKSLEVSKSLINSRTLPKLSGFAQLGYGRPALNMLSNNFESFYYFGVRMSWNLWNWNQNRNDKSLNELQSQVIDNQKEIFEKGLQLVKKKYVFEIGKLEQVINKDNEIILLRNNILKTASSQLQNGTITITDYVAKQNDQLMAKLNLENHKIELLKTKMEYLVDFGLY